jgi:hypothetical protein
VRQSVHVLPTLYNCMEDGGLVIVFLEGRKILEFRFRVQWR